MLFVIDRVGLGLAHHTMCSGCHLVSVYGSPLLLVFTIVSSFPVCSVILVFLDSLIES